MIGGNVAVTSFWREKSQADDIFCTGIYTCSDASASILFFSVVTVSG